MLLITSFSLNLLFEGGKKKKKKNSTIKILRPQSLPSLSISFFLPPFFFGGEGVGDEVGSGKLKVKDNLPEKPAITAAFVCVHAAELLGRVAAFDRYAALDFGGGICM